ncbi:hypothetical protein RhiirC2_798985 [Rhizophagus irregularis]|uniref:Uncharacterized protein n=1 Tax=Rhizophagus irregularis TaxID=588596 RepID=A0A2N1M5P4_9GLOM|nr:hypothetical protein RhiirC2_798985 [Rhizophagus irregularis]
MPPSDMEKQSDLNTYIDKSLDHSSPSKLGKKPSNIITWLDNAFFVDTFRKLNPKKISFMWTNKIISSRIDYIWADLKLEFRIMKSRIYQSIDITDSNHNIIFTKISFTDIMVTNNKGGRRAKKIQNALYMTIKTPQMNNGINMKYISQVY